MLTDSACISTGQLPDSSRVQAWVTEAHTRFASVSTGNNADYIPALADVLSGLFGISVAGISGAAPVTTPSRAATCLRIS